MLKLASSFLSGQDRLALRNKKLKNFSIVGYEVKFLSRPTLVTPSQSGEPATASSCSLSSQPGSSGVMCFDKYLVKWFSYCIILLTILSVRDISRLTDCNSEDQVVDQFSPFLSRIALFPQASPLHMLPPAPQSKVCKDTINCPEKLMKISHFNQTDQRLLSIL